MSVEPVQERPPQRTVTARLAARRLVSRRLQGQTAKAVGCAAAVGVGAFALRLPGAMHNAFWHDEVFSARIIVADSPVAALHRVARTESSPPAWYMAGWLIHHAGVQVAYVRIFSAAAGAVAAVLVIVLARRFMALWAALFAGITTAVGYEFVYQGQQLRCYAMLVLVALATVLVLLRSAEQPTTARLAQVAVCVALGVYTHYFFAFVVLGALAWSLTSLTGAARRGVTMSVIIGLATLAPFVPTLLDQHHRSSYRYGIGHFRANTVLTSYWKMFFASVPHGGVLRALAVFGLVAAVAGGAVLLWRSGPEGRLAAIMATLPVVVSALLWLAGEPIFNVRNVLEAGPFAAVCVAATLARAGRPAGPLLAAGLAVLLLPGVVRADVSRRPIPFDTIAAALAAEGWRPSDPILTPSGMNWTAPLQWYLPNGSTAVPAMSDSACEAVFTVTPRRRFPESAVVGDTGSLAVRHRLAGRYLVLRVPRGVSVLNLPMGTRVVNLHCRMSEMQPSARRRLR